MKITNLTVAFGNADLKVITATLSKSNSILLGAAEETIPYSSPKMPSYATHVSFYARQ